ncbi:hypothetical protein Tco_0480119, partial [Tanacetum coccineum]
VAVSFDSAVHRDHAGSFDAAVTSLVSLREDLSRNLMFASAGSSSSIPADYVSADSIMSFLLAVQVAFLLIMFLLVMFSFMLTEIEFADC